MTPRKRPGWVRDLLGSVDHSEPDPAPEAAEAAVELGAYLDLTYDSGELADRSALQEAVNAAQEALSGLVSERYNIDTQLEMVEAKRQERERARAVEVHKRDQAADAADLPATAAAEAMLAAISAIDTRQADLAAALGRRRAELVDREIPDAEAAVEAARRPLEEWISAHDGLAPRWLVDWQFEQELAALRSDNGGTFLRLGEPADVFTESLRWKPDAVARRVAADIPRYLAAYELAHEPAAPLGEEDYQAMVDRGLKGLEMLRRQAEGAKAAANANREAALWAGHAAAQALSEPSHPSGVNFTIGGF